MNSERACIMCVLLTENLIKSCKKKHYPIKGMKHYDIQNHNKNLQNLIRYFHIKAVNLTHIHTPVTF